MCHMNSGATIMNSAYMPVFMNHLFMNSVSLEPRINILVACAGVLRIVELLGSAGGRRHDLETMTRSIPLWPTDYSCGGNEDLGAMQAMTMGMSRWLPVHGGAFLGVEPYQWRQEDPQPAMSRAICFSHVVYYHCGCFRSVGIGEPLVALV